MVLTRSQTKIINQLTEKGSFEKTYSFDKASAAWKANKIRYGQMYYYKNDVNSSKQTK
tara:strand:- start:3270 stop:3443 length:174 start_codon:yes stop_codon:yes gene_type:complete